MAQAELMFPAGEAFERSMGRWDREVGRLFLDWMAIPTGRRWLGVVGDDGAFTQELIDRCAPSALRAMDPAQPSPSSDEPFDAAVMAQAICLAPDPAGAVAQLAQMVRPGGWVGAYVWDFTGGGAPTYPVSAGAKDLGLVFAAPSARDLSRVHILDGLWRASGLVAVETRTIRIRLRYESFEDLWEVNAQQGPMGQAIQSLAPATRARLRDHLRATLPAGHDGGIAFYAWANAVKGRVGVV